MRYLKVLWLYDLPDEPIELYSELDDQGWEVLKVEVFAGGGLGFASKTEQVHSELGETPIPAIEVR